MQIFKGPQHWGHSRHTGTSKELLNILEFHLFSHQSLLPLAGPPETYRTALLSGDLNFLLSPSLPTAVSALRINRYLLQFVSLTTTDSTDWEHESSSQSASLRQHIVEDTFFPKDLYIFMCTGILPASMYVLHTCAVPEEAGTGVTDRRELPCGDMWGLGTAPWSSQPSLQPRVRHISTAYHCCLPRTGEAGSVSRL